LSSKNQESILLDWKINAEIERILGLLSKIEQFSNFLVKDCAGEFPALHSIARA
jgi:hypothetical protein